MSKSKSGSGKEGGWKGESEMVAALQALGENQSKRHSPPLSLINKCVATALKYQAEYKMVVFEVEKYIKRAAREDRLAGVFAIDAICKASKSKDKDVFTPRFGTRIKQICSCLQDMPSADKGALARVMDEWRKKDLFPGTLPTEAEFPLPPPSSSKHSAPAADDDEDIFVPISASASSPSVLAYQAQTSPPSHSKASSAAAVVEEAKALAAAAAEAVAAERAAAATAAAVAAAAAAATAAALNKSTGPEKRKVALKLCPFREGSCPYAEKCRFSHEQNISWQESVPRRVEKKRPLPSDGPQLTLIYGESETFDRPKGRDLANPAFEIKSYPFTQQESQQQAMQVRKFKRKKMSGKPAIGSSSFSKISGTLFQHLLPMPPVI